MTQLVREAKSMTVAPFTTLQIDRAIEYGQQLRGKRQRSFARLYIDNRKLARPFKLQASNYFRPVARGQEIADEIDRLLAS